VLKNIYIAVAIVCSIYLIDLFKVDINAVAAIAILCGAIIYIGYINSSIRDLKKRVAELENIIIGKQKREKDKIMEKDIK
jgi:hypothetical protein